MFIQIHKVVRSIPHGKVLTYGGVARAAGFKGAARQVVWALRSTRGLPWHRVVGARGRILLPGEAGLEQKLRLQGEGVQFQGGAVNMHAHEFQIKRKKRKSSAAYRRK